MKFALCNETFDATWSHADICKTVAGLGYTALEIAPFTLAPLITDVSPARRKELKQQAADNGLAIVGLHWLLAKTEGLHVTSADAAVRQKTATYLADLARCCRDLGGDLMIWGSPLQRKIPAGHTLEQATDFAIDTLSRAAPVFAETGVTFLLEPLAPPDTDFMLTCAEAAALLKRLNHPNFALHQDVKAMSSETTPIPDLIRQNIGILRHFHANDPNLRGPGMGDVDFLPIFQTLKDVGYGGYVSVEVFDYTPDPVTIASESIRYMREIEARLK